MSADGEKLVRLLPVMIAIALGLLLGQSITLFTASNLKAYPLPHQIPKYPDGVALRFAMVHDVIHERYPRHGKAYYRERDRLVRAALAKEKANGPDGKLRQRYLGLLDDLGVGLDHLGRHDEAVTVMRAKLKEQEGAGLKGRDLYTTYANLGTFLIHGNFRRALQGDAEAKAPLREGLGFIHQSIEVNPEAHFGREIWQAVAVEFLLAALDNPRLLLRYDLAGNGLNVKAEPGRALNRPPFHDTSAEIGRAVAAYLRAPGNAEEAARLRGLMRHLGPPGWDREVKTSHTGRVAFDEPVLGVIGMWRLGGGANPHFALALGETMLRVGQRRIAWCAYERAVRLEERFWPDEAIRKQFVAHCRARQATLVKDLPPEEHEQMSKRFESELAHGLRYQEAYQRYEEERIKGGAALDDPHFYDAFHAQHGKIASPPSGADYFDAEDSTLLSRGAVPFFCAGVLAFVAALWVRRW